MPVHLSETSLIHKLADGGSVGESVSDERLDSSEHLDGGLVDLQEHAVVDLPKPEESEDRLHLGADFVDTLESEDKEDLWLRGAVVIAIGFSSSELLDNLSLSLLLVFSVSFGLGGPLNSPLFDEFPLFLSLGKNLVGMLLVSLLLLLIALGYE